MDAWAYWHEHVITARQRRRRLVAHAYGRLVRWWDRPRPPMLASRNGHHASHLP